MPSSKRAMSVEDLWALKRFDAVTLSPDGSRACVAVTRFDMDKNEGSSQLWLLSTDGKTQRQLTRGKHDADPQWSPDGKWIAFIARRGDGKAAEQTAQLYRIAADGGEAEKLTDLATGVSNPRWFPDSARIAFISWVWPELKTQKEQAKRFKEDKDDKVKARAVEQNHYRFWDHWFPRGRLPHLHLVDTRSGKCRDLFVGTGFHLPPNSADAGQYDISPDGCEIAFTFDTQPDPDVFSFTDIFTMTVATGECRNLTEQSGRPNGRASADPRYAPDGAWIAFLGHDYGKSHNQQARAWLIERRTGAVTGLTIAWDHGVNAPLIWSAQSDALYFTAEAAVTQPIWRLGLKDAQPSELRRGPGYGGTTGILCLSRDGAVMVYARSAQDHPPMLFAAEAAGGAERAIERFNAKLLAQLVLGRAESVTIAGFESDPVQMWIVTPPGFDPAKGKYPLMQIIHGGPHTCWGDTWHWRWNSQIFVASGSVLAAVNYHGSSGWGQRFLSSIDADWGRRELADIEAGTDHMLATGYIDPTRIVAAGGSYGGYMVAYMNGKIAGDRYRAYVCHAGCFDWVSMMGSDGYFWFGHELGAFAWEDEAAVLKQSPHHYAADFHTPTLVIHGELDYRVPYYQGLAYYNTLRVKKIPSRLVFFPDENHWIVKPQNSVLWYKEVQAWCDRFTAPKPQG